MKVRFNIGIQIILCPHSFSSIRVGNPAKVLAIYLYNPATVISMSSQLPDTFQNAKTHWTAKFHSYICSIEIKIKTLVKKTVSLNFSLLTYLCDYE